MIVKRARRGSQDKVFKEAFYEDTTVPGDFKCKLCPLGSPPKRQKLGGYVNLKKHIETVHAEVYQDLLDKFNSEEHKDEFGQIQGYMQQQVSSRVRAIHG